MLIDIQRGAAKLFPKLRLLYSLNVPADFDFHPLWLSLAVALGALALSFAPGVLLARAMTGRRFPFQDALDALFLLPLVLPPVVTGLALLILLGKRGPLGKALPADFSLLFTPWAAILAASVVAFPLVYQSARAAFAGVDEELEMAARSFGASPARTFWTVTLPLAWPGLAAGATLAFARALGEFGATVMVAGNVAGRTLTAPVAIYFAAEEGNLTLAGWYAAILAALNLAFVAVLNGYLRRKR